MDDGYACSNEAAFVCKHACTADAIAQVQDLLQDLLRHLGCEADDAAKAAAHQLSACIDYGEPVTLHDAETYYRITARSATLKAVAAKTNDFLASMLSFHTSITKLDEVRAARHVACKYTSTDELRRKTSALRAAKMYCSERARRANVNDLPNARDGCTDNVRMVNNTVPPDSCTLKSPAGP